MPALYRGCWPRNVNRDAKYSVLARSGGSTIKLVYRESDEEEWLLTTGDHTRLAEMVNTLKLDLTGSIGGAFYINEYRHVIVPVGATTTPAGYATQYYYAGIYKGLLEFNYRGGTVSASPPASLRPGDEWLGPHVGIPYILEAGGKDIRFEVPDPTDPELLRRVRLSRYAGAGYAALLAGRLAEAKGSGGGRVYINEAGSFFAPIQRATSWTYIYLGNLGGDAWFPEPRGE
jgi:hypothetical protein